MGRTVDEDRAPAMTTANVGASRARSKPGPDMFAEQEHPAKLADNGSRMVNPGCDAASRAGGQGVTRPAAASRRRRR